jgi:hypothetical protein
MKNEDGQTGNREWWGWSISGRQMRMVSCPFAPPSVLPDISPSRGEIEPAALPALLL